MICLMLILLNFWIFDFMITVLLNNKEVEVICLALSLLKKDCQFNLVTFSSSGNLGWVQHLVDTLSCIQFLQKKIHL